MKIFTAQNPVEAHIVSGLLNSQGIDSTVHSDSLFSLKGEIPMTNDTDPYVWIMDNGFEIKARSIIADYENKKEVYLPNWQCNQCNESIEAEFAVCWNCGNTDHAQ